MNRYILSILLLFTLCLTGCKKEYTIEIERIEVWRGAVKNVKKDYERKTIKAKNDEEAAESAYLSYLANMKTCCEMEKRNGQFLWIPIDYKITDSKGNTVSKNLNGFDDNLRPEIYCITAEDDSIYYELLGYFKFIGTPYGYRNPKPSPF